MDDFDSSRPYTNEALIAALEAANLPPLPDDWRKMIAEGSPVSCEELECPECNGTGFPPGRL